MVAGERADEARRTCPIKESPAAGCNTLGRDDFIRVPCPAARTTTWTSDVPGVTRKALLSLSTIE
jgi:hypothetical protein